MTRLVNEINEWVKRWGGRRLWGVLREAAESRKPPLKGIYLSLSEEMDDQVKVGLDIYEELKSVFDNALPEDDDDVRFLWKRVFHAQAIVLSGIGRIRPGIGASTVS